MNNFFTGFIGKPRLLNPTAISFQVKRKITIPVLIWHHQNKALYNNLVKNIDLRIILAVLLYFMAAKAGINLSFAESKASALWPPSGIAFSLLILFGYRIWPAITIGSLIANSMMFIHKGIVIDLPMITASTIIAIGNTLEGLIGYLFLNKLIKRKNPFTKTMDTFTFLFIVLIMCLLGAFIQNMGLIYSPLSDEINFLPQFITSYLSSVVSILVITPFVLSLTDKRSFILVFNKFFEVVALALSIIFFILLLRIDYIAPSIEQSFPLLIIPFLLWLAFRFNLNVTTMGIMLVSFLSISITLKNVGPFAVEAEMHSLFTLQIFMAIISITTLILHATVIERQKIQQKLLEFNENLEAAVITRTKELNEEINERKKVEKQMKEYNESLVKTNHELDNFVYRVSHDLRAPIASILGLVGLTKLEESLPMVRNQIDMIGNSAEKLDAFIRDILDLSRNSRLEPAKEEICFKEMIEEIFNNLQYSGDNPNIVKIIEIQQDEPFFSDSMRLKVIFNNLISNAIRYSSKENPKIEITVKVKENTAEIIVADNGIGIEEEHLPNVFKMFYRATEKNTGSGLGLYIVKESIDKLKGTITINSKENEGTKVLLKI
jgi:signal transduction histidine kinase